MDLFQLKVFCSLANNLNYQKTALELNITQPAVSYQIRSLENELDIALLKRNRHKTELTDAGMEFLHYAESICNQERLAKEKMTSLRQGRTGRLTIAGVQTYLSAISTAEAAFLENHSSVLIDTYMMDGPQLLQSHSLSEYDIYFCADNMISQNDGYEDMILCEEYMELYYPEKLNEYMKNNEWHTLKGVPFLSIIPSNHLLYTRTKKIIDDYGFEPSHISHASTIESILSLVDKNCGVSILPKGSNTDGRYRQICSLPIIHPESLIRMTVSVRKSAGHPLIQEFIKEVRKQHQQ